uniref:RING-type domain-containing protein n=1 Tax=Nothoprocta perdicaria TaxID=30464 RepID=A0A8C6ZHG7_NOTPE
QDLLLHICATPTRGDKYETCVICMAEYEEGDQLKILPCSHAYHCACIDTCCTNAVSLLAPEHPGAARAKATPLCPPCWTRGPHVLKGKE